MKGILNIDKPLGITSHDVVDNVRKITKTTKVGHSGSLDPLASGVLLVCIGKATKIIRFLPEDKRYEGTIKLGEKTDTYDTEGKVIKRGNWESISPEQITDQIIHFSGEINQTPPIYSAIKINGKKSYELARAGKQVKIKSRKVTIYSFTIQDINLPLVKFRIHCSAGTYIRSIANDLGENLGCYGHLIALRRTRIGKFSIDDSVTLDELNQDNLSDYIISPENALTNLPSFIMNKKETEFVKHGGQVSYSMDNINKLIKLLDMDRNLVAIGRIKKDNIQPIRVLIQP